MSVTKTKTRRTILLTVLLGAVIACGFRDSLFVRNLFHAKADTTKKVFSNAARRDAFVSAYGAIIQRVRPKPGVEIARDLSDYDADPARMLPAQTLKEFQRIFQDRNSFRWNAAKTCIPEYGVIIVLPAQGTELRLALCFKCLQFGLFDGESRINTEDDFDPVSKEVARLIKPLFPEDAEIQNLN